MLIVTAKNAVSLCLIVVSGIPLNKYAMALPPPSFTFISSMFSFFMLFVSV